MVPFRYLGLLAPAFLAVAATAAAAEGQEDISKWTRRDGDTLTPSSPTSDVKGAAFNRIIQIWLENTDYREAAANSDFDWVAEQGITLTNYFAVTHPSQPNYMAAAAGDYFGLDNDDLVSVPSNISTVVDLLETKGISWSEYMENMPYTGFEGYDYPNQQTMKNDYVRKHNPLILFDSVAKNASRASQIKTFANFYDDLGQQKLPQWLFITPNMTNNGHDTNPQFSARWTKGFLTPLLENEYFMKDTLVILTFDENETYKDQNRVYTILLGDAIPATLHGTTDSTYYDIYSTISTVSANWDLPSLGRWDCAANVLALVANKTGHANARVDSDALYFNQSYAGPLSRKKRTPCGWWPAPNTTTGCASGRGVLGSVKEVWGTGNGSYQYDSQYPGNEFKETTASAPATGGEAASNAVSGAYWLRDFFVQYSWVLFVGFIGVGVFL